KAGVIVRGYDPQAAANSRAIAPWLEIVTTETEAVRGAHAAVIGTEWPQFKALDWSSLRELMVQPIVVDGRRLLDPVAMRAAGFRYDRVGSSSDNGAGAP